LNIDLHSWTPLLSRAAIHEILPKPRVVILVLALLLLRKILNSSVSCHWQPRLPLTFISSTNPYLFISIRTSRVSLLVGSSILCVRKFSLMLSRNLLKCLWSTGLSLHQISGWLKSPRGPTPVNVRLLPAV